MTYQKDRITEIINSRYLFQRVIQDLIHDLKKSYSRLDEFKSDLDDP